MLDAADVALVKRDRAIPGLATVLDPELLIAALRAAYPALGIREAVPFYVHFKPATRCIVAYRLTVDDLDDELLAYADAYGPDAAVKLPKARQLARRGAGPLALDVLVLESLGIALHLFPTDRRLKVLRALTDPERRGSLLRRLLPEISDAAEGVLAHLRYKPERRYVAQLACASGCSAAIKFYNAAGYRAAKSASEAFSSRGALRVVSPAGHLDESQVLAFAWQSGEQLDALLRPPDDALGEAKTMVELTGAAIAELHGQAPGNLIRRTRAGEQTRLAAQAETVAQLCPEHRELAERLVRTMATDLAATGETDVTGVHGDFNAQQVLIPGTAHAVILDLDRAALGDPAVDLGNFAANLERESLRGSLSPEQAAGFADSLIRGYAAVRTPPAASAVSLYTAIALFYVAAEPFRYREPDWARRTGMLLGRARDILNSAG